MIQEKYLALRPNLNERQRRLWGGTEALALGWGGVSIVVASTGLSAPTIRKGIRELQKPAILPLNRIRIQGGGRKRKETLDLTLKEDLMRLIEPHTRGDPQSPLKWCSKSMRHITSALKQLNPNHIVSTYVVRRILHEEHYSLQGNRKTNEGKSHPDRDPQFIYIQTETHTFQTQHEPWISIDAKKKELIGNFHNRGREWYPPGSAPKVQVYDFFNNETKERVNAVPYGIYDPTLNRGFVNLGISADTAVFAGKSILQWWEEEGKVAYPQATKLLITADGGGSNGTRNRLWKVLVQNLADKLQIPITVAHYPPGTSKWNKIEHRLFSPISANWRGVPLESLEIMAELIAHTTTQKGLVVSCRIDRSEYKRGIKVPDGSLAKVRIERHQFHGEWNYTIYPKSQKSGLVILPYDQPREAPLRSFTPAL